MTEFSIMKTQNEFIIGMWDDLARAYNFKVSVYDGEIGRWIQTDVKSFDRIIWVSNNGDIDLEEYIHVPNSLYIFGSDDRHNEQPKDAEISVRINLPNKNLSLWSPQAGAIVANSIWRQNG